MLRGDRVRALRLDRGLTHEELAELLSINVRQIARYESNETDPSGEIVSRIASAFGVSADYLLGLTDNPFPHVGSEDLSEQERRIIAALRGGDVVSAIKEIVVQT